MSVDNFQWWDLIPVAALLPFLFIGPLLIRLYRRGSIPAWGAAAMLVCFTATVVHVFLIMLFDPPHWEVWAWTSVCVGAGLGAEGYSLFKNRSVLRAPYLNDQERALFSRAELQAMNGAGFDPVAGLADLRRRARQAEQIALRPAVPDEPPSS